jgi:cytidylate kinase
MNKLSIAIDGPSGAGKSTISREIAKSFGFIYVDTGAMYRTVGLYVRRRGINPRDDVEVSRVLPDIHIDIKYENGVQRMLLNDEDVTDAIRAHEISAFASDVSAIPEVRSFLLGMQRRFAEIYNVIMDGRDIGTVVLPSATVKIFLTASPEDRAKRRYLELCGKGSDIAYKKVLEDINTRDINDSSRAVAPLKPADDALVVDTTGNTLAQSIELIKRLIEERIKDAL